MKPYRRILLKLSGEMLQGQQSFGIDPHFLNQVAHVLKVLALQGIEIGIVMGGGNLFRGETLAKAGMNQETGDQMGMLATVMNGLALQDALKQIGQESCLLSAIAIPGLVELFHTQKAEAAFARQALTIFVGGTGNPFFTTDSAASLRAIQIHADILLKATKVDGVYDEDPKKNKNANRFATLTYDEVIQKNLQVMDMAAICLCRDHAMPVCVFNFFDPQHLVRVVQGESLGTVIRKEIP